MTDNEIRPDEHGHLNADRKDRRDEHRGGPGRGRHGGRHGGHGGKNDTRAQTFRRGRALAFLDRLHLRRSTLERQLGRPELSGIRDVISGELKATDQIIEEFIHAFELHEAMLPSELGEDSNGGREPADG
jgi:hypothetical protein